MVVAGEIRPKFASQHHNAVRKILIYTILFDTEIIAQIECVCSLFAKPIYTYTRLSKPIAVRPFAAFIYLRQ
jgi:hypothetical protein